MSKSDREIVTLTVTSKGGSIATDIYTRSDDDPFGLGMSLAYAAAALAKYTEERGKVYAACTNPACNCAEGFTLGLQAGAIEDPEQQARFIADVAAKIKAKANKAN